MKKILVLVMLVVLAACTTQQFDTTECNDNGVCEPGEQYLECSDCVPDFEVTDESMNLMYDDGTLRLHTCVVNKNGEYDGSVRVQTAMGYHSDGDFDTEEKEYRFESDEVEGDFNLDFSKGLIEGDMDFSVGDHEEVVCFSKKWSVSESDEYFAFFRINPHEEIEEKDYENNQGEASVKGDIDYGDYLIARDIGTVEYGGASLLRRHTYVNNNIEYDRFRGYYQNPYYRVYIGTHFEGITAKEYVNASSDGMELVEHNGHSIFQNEPYLMWSSGDSSIRIYSRTMNEEFVDAYLERYPSDI